MAEDNAVVFSVGFLETWIAKAGELGANNAEAAQTHLKIVEDAYHEYRKNIGIYQRFLLKLKETINSVT